jgi:O-antigen/teichoic acid export membrane protein
MAWSGALAWWLVRRRVPFRVGFDLREWRALVAAGLPLAGSAVLLTVHFRIDVLLLSLLRDPVDVGLYDAPTKLYEMVFMLPYLFGGLLMPLFVRDLAGPRATLRPRLQAACTAVLLFGSLCCAVLMVDAEQIVVLLGGSQFVASGQPLRVLAVAALLAGVAAVVRYAVTALDRQHHMLRADVISVIVAVAVHVTFIPRYGAMGAAFGRLAGDAVRMLLTVRLLRGQLTRSLWGSVMVCTLGAALLAGLLTAANRAGLHWMLGCMLAGCVTMGAVLSLPRVRREFKALASA